MKQIKLTVEAREKVGRSSSNQLRAKGRMPAVVYGKHTSPRTITLAKSDVALLLKEISGTASLVELNQDGNTVLSIVQEVQRNALTEQVVHIDFQAVSTKEEMLTHVAIHCHGEAHGVKNQNGLLDISLYQIEIRCLPGNLPESIHVDVSDLKVGEAIHVEELPKLEGVTYVAEDNHVVVSCMGQRVDAALEEDAVDGAAEKAE